MNNKKSMSDKNDKEILPIFDIEAWDNNFWKVCFQDKNTVFRREEYFQKRISYDLYYFILCSKTFDYISDLLFWLEKRIMPTLSIKR